MKKIILTAFVVILGFSGRSQSAGTITVDGDFDKFYPVTWIDYNWGSGKPTEVNISRVDVHENSTWRGSMMSKFEFHTTQWGHGSSYIRASNYFSVVPFVAGWRDATANSNSQKIIIWLRGGGTTYTYSSPVNVSPEVYDGSPNSLPYNETNGPAHSYKTVIDPYVNSKGQSEGDILAAESAIFLGNVGIGTTSPDQKLTVKGIIHTQEVRVDLTGAAAPDYVFEKDYNLLPLFEVESYIKENKHLPEVPSAKEMEANGLNLKDMNLLLLKKVEELTLHLIEMKKENEAVKTKMNLMQNEINELKK